MVELVVFKVPDGTKAVLKELAAKRGYMGLSDFLRDVVRRELQEEKKATTVGVGDGAKTENAAEFGAPQV